MSDILQILQNLHRPQLLIRAARFGLEEYNRDRDLKRVMKTGTAPSPARALNSLMAEEALLEETRQTGASIYSVSRHVEVLIALMAEARLLSRPPQQI
ncbi:MAG: DUF6477 family protein [Paracoccaceae bacterium]